MLNPPHPPLSPGITHRSAGLGLHRHLGLLWHLRPGMFNRQSVRHRQPRLLWTESTRRCLSITCPQCPAQQSQTNAPQAQGRSTRTSRLSCSSPIYNPSPAACAVTDTCNHPTFCTPRGPFPNRKASEPTTTAASSGVEQGKTQQRSRAVTGGDSRRRQHPRGGCPRPAHRNPLTWGESAQTWKQKRRWPDPCLSCTPPLGTLWGGDTLAAPMARAGGAGHQRTIFCSFAKAF